jgi:AcrR family transcriptional regulator
MPPARTSYHHGALREALLDVCLKLIETEGIGAVSLRRVAREAGVSPGAPYHHFADRAALLSALAAQGYVALAGDFAAVRAAADSPVRELTALIDTYLSFALRQPAYFRLMVRPELHEPDKNPETKAAMHAAERHLQDAVQDCVAAGVIPAERAEALELTVWSIGHGLASLLLDGLLDDPSDEPSALTFQVTALLESFLRRDLSRKPAIRNRAYGHGHEHADWRRRPHRSLRQLLPPPLLRIGRQAPLQGAVGRRRQLPGRDPLLRRRLQRLELRLVVCRPRCSIWRDPRREDRTSPSTPSAAPTDLRM